MGKKERKTVVQVFGVLTVLIIIAMFVLGVNLLKNRWHRLDFSISSVKAVELSDSADGAKYRVSVKGTAKTWFYDFNTYEFNMAYLSSAGVKAINAESSERIKVTHSGSDEFEFSFDLKDLNDFGKFIYKAENIKVDGDAKEGTEIKLFLSEYTDMLTVEQ